MLHCKYILQMIWPIFNASMGGRTSNIKFEVDVCIITTGKLLIKETMQIERWAERQTGILK